MLYGGNSEPATVDLTGTLDYISAIATPHNALRQAREGKRIAELIEATFKPGKPDARYCDFCGAEIYGVEYETLADGRDRCLNCSRTAIKTGEEFRKIFEDVKRNMESFFGIKINVGIRVEMVNAKRLHKRLGKAFIPTPNADGRVLGVAIRDKNGYSLLVENGSPRIASMLTMAHELTHIWQYVNWNDKAIRKKYGKELRLEIYEGMAKWAEIQYAYLINEPAVAKREDLITSYRRDEYGRGFLRYKAQYPFSTGTVITKNTPFMNIEEPLDPQYCGNFRLILPSDDYDPEDDYQIVKPKPPVLPPEPVKGEINRDPDVCYKYCYESLSEDEKKLYDRMLDAFENFAPEITEFDASYTLEQAKKVVSYIQADRSEIYWIRHGIVFNYNTSSEIVSSIDLTYCMTREERDSRHEEIIAAIRPFLESIHDDMSDYEVTLRVYENIIKLVDYDTIGLERQKATKEIHDPAIPDDLRSIYGVFVNKKAVCAGYAMATQFLLNLFGIECIYVTSDTHAWNIVKLEGDYYYLDTTWGDFSNTKKENSFTDEIGYNLFCITSEEAFKLEAHTPADTFRHPECTATKCNYFHRHGLYFESYDYSRIRSIVCECVANDKLSIQFKFATEAEYNKAKTDLWSNGKIVEAIKYANLTPGNRLSQDTTVYLNDKLYILTFCFKKL